MGLDNFATSEDEKEDSEETDDAEFVNCRTEKLSDPENLDTPEYISEWVSDDGLLATMEVASSYFRENVPDAVKDQAKKEDLIHLDDTSSEPIIVLTDDPEEFGMLLKTLGLEGFLRKRCQDLEEP